MVDVLMHPGQRKGTRHVLLQPVMMWGVVSEQSLNLGKRVGITKMTNKQIHIMFMHSGSV